MNLAEVFVEVCIYRVDISEACLGFSGYRIVALLILKALITTTASDSLIFLFYCLEKIWLDIYVNCLPSRRFTRNIKFYFLRKITKSILEYNCYKFA